MKILKFLFLSVVIIGLNSCSSSDDSNKTGGNQPNVESITITSNLDTQTIGGSVTFVVKTNTDADVTSSATISVGNNVVSNATFTSSTVGTYTVTANYSGKSATTIVNFIEGPSISFAKRVLIEDYTGTWCGYCPRVSFGIEQVKAQTEYAVPVAIHRGNDPYNFSGAGVLENLIGLQGYPTAMLNRLTEWKYPEPNNVNQVVALTQGTLPKLGLAMTANVSGGNVSLTVKTKFGKDITGAKLVVYALENGLIYNQVNYTSYFGGGATIAGFTHDHVVRAVFTNILGDEIPSSESVYENVYTKTFSVPVPSNVANVSNMEFVAFVVGSDKKAINVRKAVSGDNQ
ncbi:MAG: Omp28-related outer membrane protein, partial [Pedobacter sp.]